MAQRKIAACDMLDARYAASQGVNDYLGNLVAYAQEIEASLGRDMLLMPRPAPPALPASAHETPPDRRASQRTLTIYRLVQIASAGDQGFARCRNISDLGVRLELTMPLKMGQTVDVAFSPSNIVAGRVVWKVENSCGIAFNAEVNSATVLSRSAAELQGGRARPMRLSANLPARVSLDGATRETMVKDISQRGARITHDGNLHRGMSVRVVLASGVEGLGMVQWATNDMAGIYFIEPFSVDDLGSISAL
jgi:hypothetical protein